MEEEKNIIPTTPTTEIAKSPKGKKKKIIIAIVVVLLIIAGVVCYLYKDKIFKTNDKTATAEKRPVSKYRMSGNGLEYFDISFLQLENEQKNKVYSPLSIKYALAMLNEGTAGESKKQITDVIGDYKSKKYTNSKNLSLANAMYIKDSFKSEVKESYTKNLSSKYGAEVIYDPFSSAKPMNDWVSNKTFKLVNNLLTDETVTDSQFILINALAIDMEWNKKIQSEHDDYGVDYKHEKYSAFVSALDSGYPSLEFNNKKMKAKSAEISATANKYDIVKEIGEDKIRKEVGEAYKKWLKSDEVCEPVEKNVDKFLDGYIKEINSNYKQISSSTDFYFYDDENVKSFAKDLKTYDGTTLQYVGIMPKQIALDEYIKNLDAKQANEIITNLKDIKLENFKDGVITEVSGFIPMFKMEYDLNLLNDLQTLGIKDVFEEDKADLSNMIKGKNLFIAEAVHKANIEFSNDGIKAGAATALAGKGATGCGFEYEYDVPVEKINISFDKPYLYFVRDKDSGEVWFAGTVYEPIKYVEQSY